MRWEIILLKDSKVFIKDPGTDRSKAAQVAAEAVGAKMSLYVPLRGTYDFLVCFEGNFEQVAAIKMATEASGGLTNVTICEEININNAASNAAKIAGKYKAPGK